METNESLDKKIEELKTKLEETTGTPTEVYTRIVGYYRSVRNWNKGKKQEFGERVTFSSVNEKVKVALENKNINVPEKEDIKQETKKEGSSEGIDKLLYFYRKTCPNCPPVREFLNSVEMTTESIDVDTEKGFKMASTYDVMSAPTVLALDVFGNVLQKAHSRNELGEFLELELTAVNQ